MVQVESWPSFLKNTKNKLVGHIEESREHAERFENEHQRDKNQRMKWNWPATSFQMLKMESIATFFKPNLADVDI